MSHFSVLIIGKNPEAQLAPFDENEFLEFNDKTEEYRKRYETEGMEGVVFSDGRKYSKHHKDMEQYWERKCKFGYSNQDKFNVPEGAELKDVPFNELYETFDLFAENYHGAKKHDDGRYGHWSNPKAKWDWYRLGGRWENSLPLKNGTCVDKALWKDVDQTKLKSTFAVLKNEEWHEQGSMGWFGCVSDAKDDDVWEKEFADLIKDIKPNTPVAIYDCHI